MAADRLPGRELRYMGRRCQWVVNAEQVALWTGDLSIPDKFRTRFDLHIGEALRVLLGRGDDA